MEFERRDSAVNDSAPIEVRSSDTGPGRLVGYAAMFDRISSNLGGFVEVVSRRAFDRIIDTMMPLALHNHDESRQLGARSSGTLSLAVDDIGLRYEIDLPDTALGNEVSVLAKRNDLRGSSFSFRLAQVDGRRAETWTRTEQGYPKRSLDEISFVRDVGPVASPAYPSTADLGLALRSLAGATGRAVNDLILAGQNNDLRSLLDSETTHEPQDTSATPTGLGDVDALRRRAQAAWRRAPIYLPEGAPNVRNR